MSWASYAADPSRPFWGVRVLRQRASVDVKNPGLGLIATRPGLEQLVDRRIAHQRPLSPRSTGTKVLQNAAKVAADRRPSRRCRRGAAARGPIRRMLDRSSRSYRLRAGGAAVEDARMRRLLPGMAALGALFITAPAQASFTPEGSPLAVGAAQPYGVLTADFNRDGRIDAATVNGTGSNLSVFLRGPGGFAAEAGLAVPDGPRPRLRRRRRLQRRRLPGRRHAELQRRHRQRPAAPAAAAASRPRPTLSVGRAPARSPPRTSTATGASTSPRRATTAPTSSPTSNTATRLHPGGDRQPHRRHAARRRRPPTSTATGGRTSPSPTSTPARSPCSCATPRNTGFASEAAAIPVGASPEGIEAADFNGDGWPDIAVAVLGTNTVNVLLRNPGGGFTAEAPIPVGAGALGLATADFNADGRPDLAVTSNTAGTGHGAPAPGGRRLRGRRRAAGGARRQRRRRGRLQRGRQAGPRGLQRPGQHAQRVPQHDGARGAAPQPQPAGPPPPPVPGKSVVVRVVSGKVLIKLPGKGFVRQHDERPLPARNIPMGSQLDTRKGRVALTTAADTAGKKTQTAEFYDGIFQVKQTVPKKKPKKAKALITDLVMKGQIARSQCAPLKGARAAAADKKKGPKAVLGQAVGQRQGQVPHQRQVQLGDRPRHDLAGAGPLRGHAHEGAARHGRGARLQAQEDRDRQGRATATSPAPSGPRARPSA